MAKTMGESEAVELAAKINNHLEDKYEAVVKTNWCGGYYVGVGLKSQ